MDPSSLVLNPKRQKLDGGEAVDRSSRSFSNLPDEILQKVISLLDTKDAIRTSILSTRWKYLWTCIPKSLIILPDAILLRIISLLDTKDAIRTSILSKRWEYLWISLPDLEFVKMPNAARSPLVNIVERALLFRGPADIRKFRLRFPVLGDTCRVNAWISAVVRRNVQDLWITLDDLNMQQPFSLPHSLFTAARLTDLALDIPFLFKVPSTVCFSSLRILYLSNVVFSDDSVQQLFSAFPVLEDLSLETCSWVNVKFVTICAPKLLKLHITEDGLQLPKCSDACQIMIFGVSLSYFYYSGDLLNDYCFYGSSSPDEVSIEIDYNPRKNLRHIAYRFYKLLMGLSSMTDLTLYYSNAFEVVLNNAPELLAQMPLFNDLTSLELGDFVEIDSKGLLTMLQYCPCLESLIIGLGIGLSSNSLTDDGVLEPLPPCFQSSLKLIGLVEFSGDLRQLKALKILLKSAMVLEKMILHCSSEWEPEEKTRVVKQLSDHPRGSQSCKIELVQ